MRKIMILIILTLILSFSFAAIAHCWYLDESQDLTRNVSANFTNGLATASPLTIGGVTYDQIVLPGATMEVKGFGEYNFFCDNGADAGNTEFFKTEAIGKTNVIKGNGPGISGKATSSNRARCIDLDNGNRVIVRAPRNTTGNFALGSLIGIGERDRYTLSFGITPQTVSNYEGPYDYNTYLVELANVDSYDGEEQVSYDTASGSFYYASSPGLLIFSNNNQKIGFYEKDGYYEKEIFFTLQSTSVLDIRIDDYNIECNNVNSGACIVDKNLAGYSMQRNGKMIIPGKIRINKDDIPKNVYYRLNVTYTLSELEEINGRSNIETSSSYAEIQVGYLDKQDFQVEIIASDDAGACVGLDGEIGQTGEIIAPRINTKFGGSDGIIDNNECLSNNPDFVYCSQKEFLVNLTKKIKELYNNEISLLLNPNDRTLLDKKAELSRFTINIRDLDLSVQRNNELIDDFSNNIFNLNDPAIADSAEGTRTRMKSLFNKINFTKSDGISDNEYSVGEYIVTISIDANNINESELFPIGGNIVNPMLNLQIDLSPTGNKPLYDWFFYENVVDEIEDNTININNENSWSSNINNRGRIFNFTQTNDFELTDANIYSSYAVPLFVKVNKNSQNFVVQGLIENDGWGETEIFSYWSGFASNIVNGSICEELLNGETALVYRKPDTLKFNNDGDEFSIYSDISNLKDGNEYLQTVLFLPDDESITIAGPGNIYTKDGLCSVNAGGNCSVVINKNNNTQINDLQDLLDGINNRTVCVSSNTSGNNIEWKMFWNEDEILKELDDTKAAEVPSEQICVN